MRRRCCGYLTGHWDSSREAEEGREGTKGTAKGKEEKRTAGRKAGRKEANTGHRVEAKDSCHGLVTPSRLVTAPKKSLLREAAPPIVYDSGWKNSLGRSRM